MATQDSETAVIAPVGPSSFGEESPLLGAGNTSRNTSESIVGDSMIQNLYFRTGIIAQIGILLFVTLVWTAILRLPITIFSYHPLLTALGIFSLLQSILLLQPTHTPTQKRRGQRLHFVLNTFTLLGLGSGIGFIEYNKFHNGLAHFHSTHAYFGVATGLLLAVQLAVGVTMWGVYSVWGGETRAKSIWKYHRMSGYTILALLAATVVTATRTDYVVNVIHIYTGPVLVALGLIAVGLVPRIDKKKMGF